MAAFTPISNSNDILTLAQPRALTLIGELRVKARVQRMPPTYLVVCGTDSASAARYQVITAISNANVVLAHSVEEGERALTESTYSLDGVVIDVNFNEWHQMVMSLKRHRPDLFAVLFGDPSCPEPTCVNAVVRNQNLITLLDLVQTSAKKEG